jgi:general secretion pathway protein N
MRIRLRLGRGLFFLIAFLLSLVALLPLGLALRWLSLDERGFAAREAKGSVWLGALTEAQYGSVPLGTVEARLRTLPLLIGRARIDLKRHDSERKLEGGLSVSRHAFGFDDVTAFLPLGPMLSPLPIASLDLGDVSAHFADGQCASADGLVKASIAGEVAGASLPPTLSGEARCDGGALLLPLAGPSGMERLDLRLFEDGRYRFELLVRPGDDAARQRLATSGFAPAGGAYVLRAAGRF